VLFFQLYFKFNVC